MHNGHSKLRRSRLHAVRHYRCRLLSDTRSVTFYACTRTHSPFSIQCSRFDMHLCRSCFHFCMIACFRRSSRSSNTKQSNWHFHSSFQVVRSSRLFIDTLTLSVPEVHRIKVANGNVSETSVLWTLIPHLMYYVSFAGKQSLIFYSKAMPKKPQKTNPNRLRHVPPVDFVKCVMGYTQRFTSVKQKVALLCMGPVSLVCLWNLFLLYSCLAAQSFCIKTWSVINNQHPVPPPFTPSFSPKHVQIN